MNLDKDIYEFSETDYLIANPDVAAAVAAGQVASGYAHYIEYGKQEGRLWGINSRIGKVLYALNRSGQGLEIGPSHNPLTPKKHGYNVHILDHLSDEDLRKKYAGHGVSLENIETVDFVWSGEDLSELIENKSCYDWIIASHVIEHVPDLISFLQQCAVLLKPEGKLSLVIPDKRYCFDYFNPVSSTGQLLDAYEQKRIRPSPGQIFDHLSNACSSNGKIAWEGVVDASPELVHTFTEASNLWRRAITGVRPFSWHCIKKDLKSFLWQTSRYCLNSLLKLNIPGRKINDLLRRTKKRLQLLLMQHADTGEEYVDVHCWKFTPSSFNLIMTDLNMLGLVELTIISEFDTTGCEFYATLGKGLVDDKSINRLQQLTRRLKD